MDAETIRWLVGLFITFLASSVVMTVKNPNFYLKVISSIYFKIIFSLGFCTYLIYKSLNFFSDSLQEKMNGADKAITIIKDTWDSYSLALLWVGLIILILSFHWLALEVVAKATNNYNKNKN
ncbi:hypothetical protein F4W05_13365 [Ewingella americana]|uniref:Uncharacterized protein n=1 Tax=Ewingella americana TaxID=41202 RepID=A0A377N789_9GAMM|nr:hypothetical protein [Ewingella americana]KAA8727599.1 hypothetical protein F4W05_13365 [Ewingella americana]STQ42883.1 Uncharacterised protein [Ewingella americana]